MFKKFISAGLLFWIPLIFTVWILDSVIEFSDRLLVFLPTQQLPAFLAKIPGLGLIFAVIIIFLTGVIVANVLGKKIVSWWEALLDRIPIVHPIYSGIKNRKHLSQPAVAELSEGRHGGVSPQRGLDTCLCGEQSA
jgi:uncharacterized membrane protein